MKLKLFYCDNAIISNVMVKTNLRYDDIGNMFIASRQTSIVAGLGSSFRLGMRDAPVSGVAYTKISGIELIFQCCRDLGTGGTGENS